jgi:DNA-binding HxlR family transcriptional regulator
VPVPIPPGGPAQVDPLSQDCPSRQVLSLVSDRWSVLVLIALGRGYERNGELLRAIEGISQKMLTRTLRKLEYNGLVERLDRGSLPRRVDYRLSTLGESLRPLTAAMCDWAVDHLDDVDEARRRSAEHAAHPA